ncbi:Fic family protein [Propionibacteriaceae bacterium G1746]
MGGVVRLVLTVSPMHARRHPWMHLDTCRRVSARQQGCRRARWGAVVLRSTREDDHAGVGLVTNMSTRRTYCSNMYILCSNSYMFGGHAYDAYMWTNTDRPYQDLPALPPSIEVETREVLKALTPAARALAALDAACRRLPDPSMLINTIPLLEAQASSEIENIVTTNDELFRAAHGALGEPLTPPIKEALRYRSALMAGFEALKTRPLTTQTAVDICSHIQGRPVVVRNQPGTFIGNPDTGKRVYTPPEGQDVLLDHLSAWERFLHADHGLDPLIVMALQHYQFEAIHPFFDGNGRTGRIINLLFLTQSGLLDSPVLYLSGHIVRHKDEYYTALRGVSEREDWQTWILFMLRGVEVTSRWTLNLIESVATLRASTEDRIRAEFPKLPVADITRLLFTQPYIRIDDVVAAGLAQRQTASRWLGELSDHGILQKRKVGRSVVFVNVELLGLLVHPLHR